MCGSREQRRHRLLAALCSILLLMAGCRSRPAANSGKDEYQEALLELRRGKLVSAQKRADAAGAVWRDKPESEEYWKYRALQAEILVNQGRSRDALSLLERQPPDAAGFYAVRCRVKAVRVKALVRLQMIDEAAAALDEVESLAVRTAQQALMPEIGVLRAVILTARQRPVEAEAAYQAALRDAEEQNDLYFKTAILLNLGNIRVRQFRWDEAIPLLVRAQSGFESMDAKLYASVALVNIGLCASHLGDFDRASSAFVKAIEVQEREGAKGYLQGTLGELGNLYSFQGEDTKAIAYYRRALALALEAEEISDASKWAGNLATVLSQAKNWDEAERFNQQSFQLKQRIKDKDSQTFTRLNDARIAAGRGQIDVAEKLYLQLVKDAERNSGVLWETHAGLGQMYRAAKRKDLAFKHFDAAIATIEASRAQLSLPDYKITFLSRLIDFYQQYVDALVDDVDAGVQEGVANKALRVADSSRALVLSERFGRNAAVDIHSRATDYSQMARRSGTSFLVYWLAPRRSFLWAITPRGSKFFILPPQAEIEGLVQSYRSFIDNSRDPLESAPSSASKLYDILLAPVRDLVPSGSNVVVVPDGSLHNVNFETLIVPAAKPHYWIEDVTLAVAPSLSINPEMRSRPSLKSFLLIGNAVAAGSEYPALPYAAVEVQNVQRRLAALQTTVYEGVRAEPSAYPASDPSKYSVIHFAAHASANRESPLDSAIILSPSNGQFKLYARDILKQPLHADLVTISTCRGAGARVYSGEGLVGFAWAFLQAGASNVIAGLWDVTDSSTAQLMDALYEGIGAGKSPAEALRQAKLSMIASTNNFRKPYYWAPFQVYMGTKR